MRVLSLFDGLSCGQQALERAGIKVTEYFASEIDKHAIKVTMHNYPNTIQLGDVTQVKIKALYLSEVYSYICKYDNNLQSKFPEWEMLYWLDKKFTMSAKVGTQKPNEGQEVQKFTALQCVEEIRFQNNSLGSVIKSGNDRGSRKNGDAHDFGKLFKLQRSCWWYDYEFYTRNLQENIRESNRDTKNRSSKKENIRNIKEKVFKQKRERFDFAKNEKSNVVPRSEGELFERSRENKLQREVKKKERNGGSEKINSIEELIRELQGWDETNGIENNYWNILRLYKEEQVTVVEYERGFYLFKGKIDLCIGGSPCQSFSFAGKRKGMSTKDEQEILTLEHYLQLKKEGYEFEGQSYLFWEYMRLLNEVKPKYFLLENVMMGEKWERVLSKAIGVNPIEINSALVSAQHRRRLYWTNIGHIPGGLFGDLVCTIQQPKDKGILLKDILETEVDEKYYLSEKMVNTVLNKPKNRENKINPDKTNTLRTNYGGATSSETYVKIDKKGNLKENQQKASCFTAGGHSGGNHSDMDLIIVHNTMPLSSTTGKGGTVPLSRTDGKTYCLDTGSTNAIEFASDIRRLTPLECERLQTVKDNYTNVVSDSQRYKMLGNGWTVDVIVHIFSYIKI